VLRILFHLAGGPDSIAGTSRATGLRPDRTQRLIESCRRAGFLLADLGQIARFQPSWILHGWYRTAAEPTMAARGRALVAETANRTLTCGFITVLRGMRSFTLVEELEMAGEGLKMASWLGRAHPIIGSDGGPTLVMDFTPAELTLLFPARHTPRELKVFLDRVHAVVRDQVLSMEAFDDAGIVSISAPVRDSSGGVIAAACLVGTTDYMRAHGAEFEAAAHELALSVSALLRGSPERAPRASVARATGSRTDHRPRARR
jgi:DNA-binding IclR family transcriptional regulator